MSDLDFAKKDYDVMQIKLCKEPNKYSKIEIQISWQEPEKKVDVLEAGQIWFLTNHGTGSKVEVLAVGKESVFYRSLRSGSEGMLWIIDFKERFTLDENSKYTETK